MVHAAHRSAPVLLFVLLCACTTQATRDTARTERANALAHQFVIVDTHIDAPYRLHRSAADLSTATEDGDFDFPRAQQGGLDAPFMSIYIPARADAAGQAQALADELIGSVRQLAAMHPEQFALATCPDDIRAAKAAGRIALPMGMENGAPLSGDLANLDRYRDLGVAYITLAHSKSNHISDSSYDPDEHWGGLSPFGKTLIPAMNQRGLIIDVSHISDKAFWQVLELSQTPVVASHSSLRHFTPGFQRNLDDAMVEAIGRNGGVVQINFGSGFLTAAAHEYEVVQQAALERFRNTNGLAPDHPDLTTFGVRYRQEHPYPYATVDDVLNHIERAVALAGIDHVGLGSDFDGVGDSLPSGLKDASQYPTLIAGLLRRGYQPADIEKILGGNLLRVWRQIGEFAESQGYAPICQG